MIWGCLAGWAVWLSPLVARAGAGDGVDGHSVIVNIAVCLVAASACAYVMKLLRQPLLLGYILAGVAVGPAGLRIITEHAAIVTLAEIGLILLLFMIGLEIDAHKMLQAGRRVLIPGIVQFPLCMGAAYAAFLALEATGLSLGAGPYARLYVAVGISLSSTMIVVKLLFDKMELDTLPGRITVGILVFQDLWAIICLATQPNLGHPEIGSLARTFGAGALLVGVALLASRHVLPHVFRSVAQVPELMLVLTLGWCFLVALVAAHPGVGLSMEMGSLIAGISLATFPYNLDVVAKAISIRDFFITLFFVALGMQIPVPSLEVITVAGAAALVALLSRGIGVFGVLYALRSGHRVSLLAAINLGQISEFSLVILSLGVDQGHIGRDTLTCAIWVFALLAVFSTYTINASHTLQERIGRLLRRVGLRDVGDAPEARADSTPHAVVILGFFRIAAAFFEETRQRHPHLLRHIKVIDFNPQVKQRLDALGVACVYGDISHQDTLHHAQVHTSDVILCTIPDAFLKGTSNRKLLTLLRNSAPRSKIVVTAETPAQARDLYERGADFVLQASRAAGTTLADVLERTLLGGLEALRREGIRELATHPDLLD
jgi:Kef-type K+ transport system membrane component KefB